MQEKSTMQQYLKPGVKSMIGFFLCLLVMIGAIIGAVSAGSRSQPDPIPITKDTDSGTYCYLDVQFLTTWVYRVTGDSNYTYYEAADADGNWYVVSLSDAQYDAMSDIVDFTYDSTDTIAAPAPYRLTGMVRSLPDDDAEAMADGYVVSLEDYYDFYGTIYLNAKSSPDGGSVLWVLLAGLAGLLAFIFLLPRLTVNGQYKRSIKRLGSESGLERAQAEFEGAGAADYGCAVVSEHYLYAKNAGVVLPIADIVWMYEHVQRFYFVISVAALMVRTLDGKSHSIRLSGKHRDDNCQAVMAAVAAKKPDVLFGFTIENSNLYKQTVRDAKKQTV